MIEVEQLLNRNLPALNNHQLLHKSALWMLRGLLCEREIKRFAEAYPNLQGVEFVEHVLDFFNFNFTARDSELDNIPTEGRLIIVANHPIGSLDGLALLKLVNRVRSDVKILANDVLQAIEPLHELLIPVPVFKSRTAGVRSEPLKRLYQHLEAEGALVVFPAGEVSRLRPQGVRDHHWNTGFLKMALRAQAPILPIHVKAHNSAWFYGASMLYKPLATLLLVQEMFRQQCGHIDFRIGELVPLKSFNGEQLTLPQRAKLFRRHVYRLGQNKKGVLKTQRPIARAEPRQVLKKAVEACERLGKTQDALVQFFGDHFPDPDNLAQSRTPFMPNSRPLPDISDDYSDDLLHLKHFLAHQGAAIPTLFKQYADLCEKGGVRFLGFNVDADFANAVDGLVMVDVHRLKAHKRERYLGD